MKNLLILSPKAKKYSMLIAMLLLFASPFLLAWQFHQASPVLKKLGTVNRGHLIVPPMAVSKLLESGTPVLHKKWHLLYLGNADSVVLDKLARIRLALGKDYSRVDEIFGQAAGEASSGDKALDFFPNASPESNGSAGSERSLLSASLTKLIISREGAEKLLSFVPSGVHVSEKPAGGIFIMDPQGRVILSYPESARSEDIYQDLQRLLKYSGNSI